jgi:hypothetical protein
MNPAEFTTNTLLIVNNTDDIVYNGDVSSLWGGMIYYALGFGVYTDDGPRPPTSDK